MDENPTLLEILAALPDLIVAVDRDLRLLFMNRPQGGFAPDQVVGHSILDYMDPAFRGRVRELIEGVFATAQPTTYEIPAIDAHGARQWHEGTIHPLLRGGVAAIAVISTTNITARKLAEEEAKKLRRLVPVCSWCRNVRTDDGYWGTLEAYIEESKDAKVTHGMCPACTKAMLDQVG